MDTQLQIKIDFVYLYVIVVSIVHSEVLFGSFLHSGVYVMVISDFRWGFLFFCIKHLPIILTRLRKWRTSLDLRCFNTKTLDVQKCRCLLEFFNLLMVSPIEMCKNFLPKQKVWGVLEWLTNWVTGSYNSFPLMKEQ